jgi:hypothetical protein
MQERKRRPRRNRHYRIDHELTADDLTAYCDHLREPRTTNKSAHAWLVARGYASFSESAVARHKRHYLEQVHDNRQAMDSARQWAQLARDVRKDGGDVVDGAVILHEVMAVKALFNVDTDEPVSPEDLKFFGELVNRLVNARVRLGKLQLALKKAGDPAGGRALVGAGDDPAGEAQPLTEEQKEEEQYRKICGMLKQPNHPPEVRAELKKKWEEAEARMAADLAAGRIRSLEEEFGGTN